MLAMEAKLSRLLLLPLLASLSTVLLLMSSMSTDASLWLAAASNVMSKLSPKLAELSMFELGFELDDELVSFESM
ncbi:hypothetical protein BpHYR1_025593 [Brachionus plicatilis]|uniref:Uncharacterized protein n=1 Tax=Brachionus plicatilis TaxID=10195 RepID=A0A3M7S538_BRAPC|nr:hypothetical protein BpHYR1_025593 [Brachionus plicatilis]